MASKSGKPKLSWDPYKYFDVSAEELELERKRAEIRKVNKAEFAKKASNPFRPTGYTFIDPAMQRFYALRVFSYAQYRKESPRALSAFFFGLVFPMAGIIYYFNYENAWKEKLFRTGQVAYKDRHGKLFN